MSGKRSRAFRAYQKVKTLKPARSLFDLSHDMLFTGDMGKLYPICAMEMTPGDTFHIWNEIVTRMQPLNAPILHDIKLNTHFFFIPYRILDENFVPFITGGVNGENGGNDFDDMPADATITLPRWRPTNTAIGSLWDYLGFPVGVVPEGALPIDYIRRAYNRVWNEYYRDETLQDEVDEENEEILHRNWRKDYFTSALTSQQRGVAPAMPLTGQALQYSKTISFTVLNHPASFEQNVPFDITVQVSQPFTPETINSFTIGTPKIIVPPSGQLSCTINSRTYIDSNTIKLNVTCAATTIQPMTISSMTVGDGSATVTDLTTSSSFDVKDLRVAFQIQRWLELANRGGVRYTEFLRSFFGVSPRDDRLQRPEYIGGTSSPIVISEVLQTSSTENEATPIAYMAGHGVGANRTYVGSYTAVEFGIVMGFLSVMPSPKYQQGINKQWLRRTKYDFCFPQFTGLSEQAIEEAEIYAQDTEAKNRKIFGYNEIYDELRSMPSKIAGKMRSTFDYWHLARKFESEPALNSDFIECNPSKRIFAVPSEDGFIFNVANLIRAVRPIPKYGTPKGV